jgi:hypothetical protein
MQNLDTWMDTSLMDGSLLYIAYQKADDSIKAVLGTMQPFSGINETDTKIAISVEQIQELLLIPQFQKLLSDMKYYQQVSSNLVM